MSTILTSAGGFLCIIALSYLLKKKGIFRLEDKQLLSNLLLTINLPCVIISGFRSFQYDPALVLAVILGLVTNLGGVALGALLTRGKPSSTRALQMMSCAGYNVSIFTIPFVASFLSSTALIGALMFDIGNAIMVFGTTAAITSAVLQKKKQNPIPLVVHRLSHSVPFMTYMVMILLVTFGIRLPEQVYVVTDLGASATAFLAMVLIGILMEFKMERSDLKEVCTVTAARYGYSALLALLLFQLPFDIELRKALIIAVFSPISTASVVFTQTLGCKPSLTGVVSSISILLSMAAIVATIIFL